MVNRFKLAVWFWNEYFPLRRYQKEKSEQKTNSCFLFDTFCKRSFVDDVTKPKHLRWWYGKPCQYVSLFSANILPIILARFAPALLLRKRKPLLGSWKDTLNWSWIKFPISVITNFVSSVCYDQQKICLINCSYRVIFLADVFCSALKKNFKITCCPLMHEFFCNFYSSSVIVNNF